LVILKKERLMGKESKEYDLKSDGLCDILLVSMTRGPSGVM